MKKNKKFEIIEESRFLDKNGLDKTKGGEVIGGGGELCLLGKDETCSSLIYSTCVVPKYGVITCYPNYDFCPVIVGGQNSHNTCNPITGNETCPGKYTT